MEWSSPELGGLVVVTTSGNHLDDVTSVFACGRGHTRWSVTFGGPVGPSRYRTCSRSPARRGRARTRHVNPRLEAAAALCASGCKAREFVNLSDRATRYGYSACRVVCGRRCVTVMKVGKVLFVLLEHADHHLADRTLISNCSER